MKLRCCLSCNVNLVCIIININILNWCLANLNKYYKPRLSNSTLTGFFEIPFSFDFVCEFLKPRFTNSILAYMGYNFRDLAILKLQFRKLGPIGFRHMLGVCVCHMCPTLFAHNTNFVMDLFNATQDVICITIFTCGIFTSHELFLFVKAILQVSLYCSDLSISKCDKLFLFLKVMLQRDILRSFFISANWLWIIYFHFGYLGSLFLNICCFRVKFILQIF